MFEKSNVIKFERGLELRDKKEAQDIEMMRKKIIKLQEGKEKFEEWRKIALEQGDEKSALLYELEIVETEILIMQGEILCHDADVIQNERWQRNFQHSMEIERKQESEDRLVDIDEQLEFISTELGFLFEERDNLSEKDSQKIQELEERKKQLEDEKKKYLNA